VPAKKTAKKKSDKIDFEASMAELEQLVETMEHGDISLEDSLKQFERGIVLTRNCQKALLEAEQKVQILTKENGSDVLRDFNTDNPDNSAPED
jgi:exodeoxyribonuclease VII small subunit